MVTLQSTMATGMLGWGRVSVDFRWRRVWSGGRGVRFVKRSGYNFPGGQVKGCFGLCFSVCFGEEAKAFQCRAGQATLNLRQDFAALPRMPRWVRIFFRCRQIMNSGANERAVIGTTNAPTDDPPFIFYADLHVFRFRRRLRIPSGTFQSAKIFVDYYRQYLIMQHWLKLYNLDVRKTG
jgi:hypothetical protein